MRFQNCIFDLYGTLVDIRTDEDSPALWASMAGYFRDRGADYRPGELHDSYLRTVQRMERGMVSPPNDVCEAHLEIQIEYVFQSLFADKGVGVTMEEAVGTGKRFRRLSTEYIRLYDGARELLEALRAGGQNVWLLSNAQAIFTRDELAELDISGFFDGIYFSSDYGVKKPDRRFFNTLLRERAIDPESAVMVGNDGLCDIAGARSAGLSTIYIRSNISPAEPLPKADYVLEHMDLGKVRVLLTSDL